MGETTGLMEETTGRISETAAALYGGLGGGLIGGIFALLGTLGGLWLERRLRARGELRCQLAGFIQGESLVERGGMTFSPAPDEEEALYSTGTSPRGTLRITWEFDLRFFNEKDEDTGLYDVSVAFVDDRGEEAIIGPLSETYQHAITFQEDPPDIVNLPSQRWESKRIDGTLFGAQAARSYRWQKLEVRAKLPDGTPFRGEVRNRRPAST